MQSWNQRLVRLSLGEAARSAEDLTSCADDLVRGIQAQIRGHMKVQGEFGLFRRRKPRALDQLFPQQAFAEVPGLASGVGRIDDERLARTMAVIRANL